MRVCVCEFEGKHENNFNSILGVDIYIGIRKLRRGLGNSHRKKRSQSRDIVRKSPSNKSDERGALVLKAKKES